jgi:tripartite motif-containing protein 71
LSHVFSSKWGTLGSADGQFRYPFGVALDSSGNVFVTDQGNHRIQKFTSSGIFMGKLGSRGSADGQFRVPLGIAIKSPKISLLEERVFVADTNNNRIQVFKPKFVVNP